MLKKSLIIIIFIIIIASLSFIFFIKKETKLINKTENDKFNNFEISNIEQCRAEGGFRAICATGKNNSDIDYKFVQVMINLLDDSGNLVANSTDTINNLDRKQNWKFRAAILDESATAFLIKDVIGNS